MTRFLPILLLFVGGFLFGGVYSLRKKSVPAAVILGVFATACVVGAILWLIGGS
ncbi:MAG TPA: hypothetical protein VIJ00_12320 [Nakamurella sp.]